MLVSKYQAYPEYKNSGVEWLENIPVSWNVLPIKRLSKIFNGSTPKSGEKLYWDGDIAWITPADLGKSTTPYIAIGSKSITEEGYKSCGTSLVPKNSIILSSRAPIGTLGIALNQLCTNQGCKSLVVKKRFIPKFIYYVLLSSSAQLNLLGRGTTFLELSSEELASYKVGTPTENEQEKIANFLDHETAKIDTLIEKQQQLIKLLKEKRQAVISHAVTKGLNPNAPMRDSGIEWLGEVPIHWSVVPIKRICEVKDGTHDTPKYVDRTDESLPLITSKDFNGDSISFDNVKYISIEDHAEIIKRSNTEVGDILMSMIGGNIGKALIVRETAEFSIKNVALFKTVNNEKLAKYILLYLQSGLLDVQISLLSRGGAQGFLSLGDLRNLVFFKLPENELNDIIEFLSKRAIKYDNLIKKAVSAIKIIQERRTALISAAVTGKIDVRKWQAPEPSNKNNKEVAA